MKATNRFSFLAVGTALALLNLSPVSAQDQAAPATTATDANGNNLTLSLKIPSKVDEIAQLAKAGVGDPVILSYIKSSDTAYNLNAQDIIKLRDQGVSTEVTTALIQRDAAVRQAAQDSARATQAAAATVAVAPTYQTQPVVETPAPVTYVPVQPVSTVSVAYIGYPRYYASDCYPVYSNYRGYYNYPGYVSFGAGYCAAPRFSIGVGFGGGHRGGFRSTGHFRR